MNKDEIAALAVDAFEKMEIERNLGMAAMPVEYEARKKSAIAYAIARSEAEQAKHKLDMAITEPSSPTPTKRGT